MLQPTAPLPSLLLGKSNAACDCAHMAPARNCSSSAELPSTWQVVCSVNMFLYLAVA